MHDELHPELQLLLEFFLRQRKEPPKEYTHVSGLIPSPSFYSVGTLQQHLNNPLLGPDWVTLVSRGQRIPLEPACLWKNVQTKKLLFMDKELFDEHLTRGAAVVLEGLDILDPRLNAFAARLDAALPCALSNCVAFFSQRENEAYGGHRDSDDVLVIHVSGEKLWQLFAPQQRAYIGNAPLTRQEMGSQIAEVVMRPGDALYIRAGVPHMCRTSGEHSLHLSFDLCDSTPNVEQITHEANARYNRACEDPYAPASKVVDRYIALMKSDKFQSDLESAAQQIRTNASLFRARIGKSSGVQALSKYDIGKAGD